MLSADSTVRASQSVISGVGALCTYTRLVPPSAVSDATREALSQQVESRPKVQVLVWIEGTYVYLYVCMYVLYMYVCIMYLRIYVHFVQAKDVVSLVTVSSIIIFYPRHLHVSFLSTCHSSFTVPF